MGGRLATLYQISFGLTTKYRHTHVPSSVSVSAHSISRRFIIDYRISSLARFRSTPSLPPDLPSMAGFILLSVAGIGRIDIG
jgi:hypothetical protein